jgi:hypothetical protein
VSDDPFNLTEFALTPEQAAKLAPLQKKPGGKPEAKPARQKAAKLTKTWAQIPHHQGLQLAKRIRNPALAVLLILEAAAHEAGSNRVKLTNKLLKPYKITHQSKTRGLRQLAAAGVISVEWGRAGGKKTAPIVTHHWYTEDGTPRWCGRTI